MPMPNKPLDNNAVDPIRTFEDIERRLNDLGMVEKYNDLDKTVEYDDLVKPVKLAIDLSTAFSEPWEYHGPGSDRISKDSLEYAAEEDATSRNTRPPSDAVGPVGAEADVIKIFIEWSDRVYNIFRRYNAAMEAPLLNLKSGIEKLISTKDSNAGDDAKNYYSEGIAAAQTADRSDIDVGLKAAMADFREKKKHFRAFRRAHGLHRSPRYESSIVAFAMIAIICVVVETAVNGFMYAQASDLGLIGGWGVAAGLSTVIFSLSFVAGWVLTQKNAMLERHQSVNRSPNEEAEDKEYKYDGEYNWERSIIPPLRGWVGFLFIATTVLVLISLVCVYRDEASMLDPTSGVHPMTESLRRIAEFDLLPRADIEGVLLVFVNLAIMVIGMYKGYNHFDTVPGYRDYARELETERRNFKEAIDRASEELGVTGDALGAYESKLRVVKSQDVDVLFDHYKRGVDARNLLKLSIDIQVRKIEEDCNDRLTAYREKNKEHRPGVHPPPEYFKERWTPPSPPDLHADGEFRSFDDIDRDELVGNLRKHREHAIGRVRTLVEERYQRRIMEYRAEAETEKNEVNQNEK